MFSNYFIVNNDLLTSIPDPFKSIIANRIYSMYLNCLQNNTRPLSLSQYLNSKKTKYPILYLYCPKCKKAELLSFSGGKRVASSLKFCPCCGEPSINHRYLTGRNKIIKMLKVSQMIKNTSDELEKYQNQQLEVLMCSVYEVYLREFYADILNTKFVATEATLYENFSDNCMNDFICTGKTQRRFKRELGIDYKKTIDPSVYKALTMLSDFRNVIVHNNGICDAKFRRKYTDIERHSEIYPQYESLCTYLSAIDFAVIKLDEIYQQEIRQAAINDLKLQTAIAQLNII